MHLLTKRFGANESSSKVLYLKALVASMKLKYWSNLDILHKRTMSLNKTQI